METIFAEIKIVLCTSCLLASLRTIVMLLSRFYRHFFVSHSFVFFATFRNRLIAFALSSWSRFRVFHKISRAYAMSRLILSTELKIQVEKHWGVQFFLQVYFHDIPVVHTWVYLGIYTYLLFSSALRWWLLNNRWKEGHARARRPISRPRGFNKAELVVHVH